MKCLSEWPLKMLLNKFKIFESKYSNIFAQTYKVKAQIIGRDGVYLYSGNKNNIMGIAKIGKY